MGRRGKRSSRGLHRGPSPRRERASSGGPGGTFSPRKGARSCYARIDGAQESGASRAAEAEGRRARGALQRQFLDDQLEPLRVPARVGHWHGVGCGPLRVRPVSVRPVEPGPLVGERRVGLPAVQRAGGVERGAPSVGVGVPDPGRHLGDVLRTTANKRGTEPGQTDHVGARQRSLPTLRPLPRAREATGNRAAVPAVLRAQSEPHRAPREARQEGRPLRSPRSLVHRLPFSDRGRPDEARLDSQIQTRLPHDPQLSNLRKPDNSRRVRNSVLTYLDVSRSYFFNVWCEIAGYHPATRLVNASRGRPSC